MDRNIYCSMIYTNAVWSLSARRAWIEIDINCSQRSDQFVALRKESVDRNNAMQIIVVIMRASLSARRAWIEIAMPSQEVFRA